MHPPETRRACAFLFKLGKQRHPQPVPRWQFCITDALTGALPGAIAAIAWVPNHAIVANDLHLRKRPMDAITPAAPATAADGAGATARAGGGGRRLCRRSTTCSASVPVDRNAGYWRRLASFFGPGYLVAVGYMDPGNWATVDRRRL